MKNITIKNDITIREAMLRLDTTAQKCLVVIDDLGKLIGTLTDGDIRRSVLKNKKFSSSIKFSYNKSPIYLVDRMYKVDDALKMLKDKKLDLIPIVDEKKVYINYITWEGLGKQVLIDKQTLSSVQVVVMAGGKGKRLKPFTNVLPKPLIPIKGKTVIEHIIDKFNISGCNDFYITVNYRKKILKAYFEEIDPRYNISFIDEKKPLGTAGSIKLAEKT